MQDIRQRDINKAAWDACDTFRGVLDPAQVVGNDDYALYGMEVNGSTWALARMNMFLHGADAA